MMGLIIWFSLIIGIPFGTCVGSYDRSLLSVPKQKTLFVFGDSLFDPGNNNYINTTTEFQANWSPYGESFFNPPTGRFCDGRLIPDFIGNVTSTSDLLCTKIFEFRCIKNIR